MDECSIEYCDRPIGAAIIQVKFDDASFQFRVHRLTLVGKPLIEVTRHHDGPCL